MFLKVRIIYNIIVYGEWEVDSQYEVRELFPWEMLTKIAISYLLNVENNRNFFFNKIHDEKCIFWRLVQQELNVAYETSIF